MEAQNATQDEVTATQSRAEALFAPPLFSSLITSAPSLGSEWGGSPELPVTASGSVWHRMITQNALDEGQY